MDPVSIVDDTEWTLFRPQTDRRAYGQGETSIPPFNFAEAGGIKICSGLMSQTAWTYYRKTLFLSNLYQVQKILSKLTLRSLFYLPDENKANLRDLKAATELQ